jgi:hypothetical protein
VFGNRVLRRIFEPKRDEVMAERRKLHNEELHNQVKEDWMGGACSTNGEEEEHVQVIGGKAKGKETARKTKT